MNGVLLSKNRPVTASGAPLTATVPTAAAVDGTTSTKWMGMAMRNWWQVDLGSIHHLSLVQTQFYANRAYTYAITRAPTAPTSTSRSAGTAVARAPTRTYSTSLRADSCA